LSNKKKGVIVQVIEAYTNTAFVIISGLFFVPLYFKFIDINTYGSWLASGNILNLLGLLEGGVSIVFSQKLAVLYGANKKEDFATVTVSGLITCLIIAALFISGTLLISIWIPGWVKSSSVNEYGIRMAFILAGLGSAISILNSSFLVISRAWHSNKIPTIIAFISSLLGLITIFIALTFLNFGIVSLGLGALVRAICNLIGNSIFTISKWNIYCGFKPKYSFIDLKELIIATIPVFGSNLLGALLNNSKELLLAILINPTSAAILALTGRIFSLASMIVNPLVFSFFTALSSISSSKDKLVFWITKLFKLHNFVSGILFGLAICLNTWFVNLWVGSDKFGGIVLTVLLAISNWLLSKYNINIMLLNTQSVFKPTSIINLVDVIIRLALIGVLVFLHVQFQIIYLPIIECLSMIVATLLLEIILAKKLNNRKAYRTNITEFFLSMGTNILLALFLYFLINLIFQKADQFNSVNSLIISALISLIGFFLYIFLNKNNKEIIAESLELIKK